MHVRTLICVEQPSAKSYMLWLTSDGTSILVPSRKNEWKLGRISTLGLVPHLQARKRPWLESSITQTCHMHFAHWLLEPSNFRTAHALHFMASYKWNSAAVWRKGKRPHKIRRALSNPAQNLGNLLMKACQCHYLFNLPSFLTRHHSAGFATSQINLFQKGMIWM